jgi:urease accessory protein
MKKAGGSPMTSRSRIVALVAGITAAATSVEAHHMEGGQLPASFSAGILSGLAHPVIGVDHLLALVAVALLARGPRAPIAFVLASLAGVALPAFSLVSWASEPLVAASVVALGLLLFLGPRDDDLLAIALSGLIGALHGFAYAEAIVGAETTPLVAYLAGLGVVQIAIVTALGAIARWAVSSETSLMWTSRIPGAAVAAGGCLILAGVF